MRFATTHGDTAAQDQSLDDYVERAGEGQDKIYYLLAENHATAAASPHLEQLRKRGIEVLLLSDRIDGWVVDGLGEYEGRKLVDVAREALDLDDESAADAADDGAHKELLERIAAALTARVESVQVSRRLVDSPACVVAAPEDINPQLRRMLEASGQALPDSKPILEVNVTHPLLKRLSGETDAARFEALSAIVLDHALLAEGAQLDNPADYVQRMNRFLVENDTSNAEA